MASSQALRALPSALSSLQTRCRRLVGRLPCVADVRQRAQHLEVAVDQGPAAHRGLLHVALQQRLEAALGASHGQPQALHPVVPAAEDLPPIGLRL